MFRSLLTNLITVIEEFPWADGGTAIGTGLRALFENGITGEQIGSAIASLLNGAITGAISLLNELLQSDTNLGQEFINALSTFLENFKPEQFVELCKKVGEMFHTIVYDALVGLGENTSDLLDTAWECVKGIWEGIKTYILGPEGEEEGGSLGDALVTLLKNALTWITDHWSEIDATIQDIATVLGGEFAKIFDPANEIWGSMGETVGNLFNSILDGIITWCETNNNLENLSVSIRDFIKGALEKIDTNKINSVISKVGELIHSILSNPKIMYSITEAINHISWSEIAGIVWDLFWTQLKLKIKKFSAQVLDILTFGILTDPGSNNSEKFTPKTEDYTKAGEECGKAVVSGYSGAVQDTKYAKEIEEAGKAMGNSTVAGINESTTVEAFMPAGANVSAGYSAGITAGAPIAVAAGQQLSTDVLNSLNGGLGCASPSTKTYETGINVVQGFINGIKASTPQAKTAMQDLAKSILQAFSTGIFSQDVVNAAKFRYLAKLAIEGFARGCEEYTNIATDAVRAMAKAVVAAATEDGCLKRGSASDASGSFFEIGQNIVLGLADGIRDKTSEAVRAMHDLNEALSDTSTGENEIDSPSKRYERYGKFIVEGLNIGILSGIGDSVDAVKSWSNAMQVPAIAMGTTVPAGMSYSANKASSIAGNNTTDIINNSYMNNSDVVTAINNLIGVVSNLDLSVRLDSKTIESGSRDVRQRRGATIATGGIYNYS